MGKKQTDTRSPAQRLADARRRMEEDFGLLPDGHPSEHLPCQRFTHARLRELVRTAVGVGFYAAPHAPERPETDDATDLPRAA